MKIVSKEKLSYTIEKIKENFSPIGHEHTDYETTFATIDALLTALPSTNVIHNAELLSTILDTYILNIDYDALLAFDTTEIVTNNTNANTTSVLGRAILGQMVLA